MYIQETEAKLPPSHQNWFMLHGYHSFHGPYFHQQQSFLRRMWPDQAAEFHTSHKILTGEYFTITGFGFLKKLLSYRKGGKLVIWLISMEERDDYFPQNRLVCLI